ncbi:MAG: winged helix-turn-helix domain-containing protein [Methanosarcinales archaeon]|nr:winged helix-turn-helix domain-containing protein [Methanosarcinales archaeon]HDJ37810.1 hypothetical protein [Methanosarcinales archaeon]
MSRRNRIDIVVDILKATNNSGTSKTKIVYTANLNFNRASRYLSMLQEKQMIEKDSGTFRITASGKEYLQKASEVLGCF